MHISQIYCLPFELEPPYIFTQAGDHAEYAAAAQIAKITALLFSRPLLFIEKRHARSGQKSLFYNFLNWYLIHQKWFEIKDLMKWRRHSLPPRIFPELDTCKPYLIAYIRNSTLRNKKNIARRSMLDLDLLVGRKLARSVHCPDIELY